MLGIGTIRRHRTHAGLRSERRMLCNTGVAASKEVEPRPAVANGAGVRYGPGRVSAIAHSTTPLSFSQASRSRRTSPALGLINYRGITRLCFALASVGQPLMITFRSVQSFVSDGSKVRNVKGSRQPLRHCAQRFSDVHWWCGSGESKICRYLLENDLAEAIIDLAADMFYNTRLATYIWIVSKRKLAHRCGTVQFIDSVRLWQKYA